MYMPYNSQTEKLPPPISPRPCSLCSPRVKLLQHTRWFAWWWQRGASEYDLGLNGFFFACRGEGLGGGGRSILERERERCMRTEGACLPTPSVIFVCVKQQKRFGSWMLLLTLPESRFPGGPVANMFFRRRAPWSPPESPPSPLAPPPLQARSWPWLAFPSLFSVSPRRR